MRFHPGVEYRHCASCRGRGRTPSARRRTTSPAAPRSSRADRPRRSSARSWTRRAPSCANAASPVGSPATQIWLWGQGVKPALPPFDRDVRRAGSHVVGGRSRDRVSACSPESRSSTCPARPPASTTTTARRPRACLHSLADRDLFVLHVEATDEAGHQGRADVKVDALERWDPTSSGRSSTRSTRRASPTESCCCPITQRPATTKTHSADTVPYLLFDSATAAAGGTYTEPATAACAPVPAHALMPRLVRAVRRRLDDGRGRYARSRREGIVCVRSLETSSRT